MDKVTGKVVRTEADWAALVDARARSGQSAAVFCREQGITYSLFLYYRRKILKMRQGFQSIARSTAVQQTHYTAGTPIPRAGGFIPVRIEDSCSMRFRFPTGLVLESEGIPPASWVVEVAQRWVGIKDVPC